MSLAHGSGHAGRAFTRDCIYVCLYSRVLELGEIMPSGDKRFGRLLSSPWPWRYLGLLFLINMLSASSLSWTWRTGDGIGVGIYAFRKGFGPAKCCGAGIFLIGALVYSLRSIGVLPAVPVAEYNSGWYRN